MHREIERFAKMVVGVATSVSVGYAMFCMNDYELSKEIIGAMLYIAITLCPKPDNGSKS